MNKSIPTIVSVVYALTMAAPMLASAETLETGGDRLMAAYASTEAAMSNAEIDEQQIESNSIYSELTTALTNDSESIPFAYAGGYINDESNLVVCVADDEKSNEDITEIIDDICVTDISDIVIEKVKYSYEELNQAREDFEASLDNQMDQASKNNDTDLYDLLSSITSNSIDEEYNKLIVYVPELNDEKLAVLEYIFDCGDIVTFEEDDDLNKELAASLCPGRAIYGLTDNGKYYSRFSIGYRARYKNGSTTYYGFTTAGHGTKDLDSGKYIYSETSFSSSDKIGYAMIDHTDGNCDAAFVYLYSGNTFINIAGGDSIVGYTYMTSVAKNSTIYKVGSTTGWTEGKVTSSDCSIKMDGEKMTHQVKCKIKAESGDSGGLFYMYYNPDGQGGYLPAGVLVGGGNTYQYYTQCSYVYSDMSIEPY